VAQRVVPRLRILRSALADEPHDLRCARRRRREARHGFHREPWAHRAIAQDTGDQLVGDGGWKPIEDALQILCIDLVPALGREQ
jgi:hypothetical protein